MAKYTANHTLRAWKAHRCVACGSVFRYRFTRKAQGVASTPEAAQMVLKKRLDNLIATSTDLRPCPQCGVIQPDMVGQRRGGRFRLWAILLAVALVVILILSLSRAVNIPPLATVLTLVGALTALGLTWAGMRDFNRDLDANRRAAAAAAARDEVRLDQAGALDVPRQGPAWRRPALPVFGLLALGFMLLPAAELERTLRGWPLNADCYPPVVGPGDTTRIYLPNRITSVKSLWRADSRVDVANSVELGLVQPALVTLPVQWPSKSKEDAWGGTLRVKTSEKNNSSASWTEVSVPADGRLGGRRADLDVRLLASWPQMESGGSGYTTRRQTFRQRVPVTLANAVGAGDRYRALWYGGSVGGTALLALAAWLLGRRTRADAQNTQLGILPLEDAPPAPGAPTA